MRRIRTRQGLSSTRRTAPPWCCVASIAVVALLSPALFDLPADREIGQYVRKTWTVEQGLPHGTVRGFAQTPDGDLWLATYEGLVRFNGEAFRLFDRAGSPGLRNNSIRTVLKGVTSLRRITFDIQMPPDLPQLDAAPTQLKQILYNLMANRAKFSREESNVHRFHPERRLHPAPLVRRTTDDQRLIPKRPSGARESRDL